MIGMLFLAINIKSEGNNLIGRNVVASKDVDPGSFYFKCCMYIHLYTMN